MNRTVFTLALLLTPLTASAETGGVNAQTLLQVLLGLGAVLALIFGMAWLLRRVGHTGLMNNQHLRIIACLSLGAREKIVLLEVGEQQILVGVTPHQINAIEVFGSPVVQSEEKPGGDFSRRLMEIIKRGS